MLFYEPIAADLARAFGEAGYLEADEEKELAERWLKHGDRKAVERLVLAHGRMVAKIARGYRHFGIPVADLVQEAQVGLMEAASRFDPEKGFRFSTYASWWAKAAIQNHILRNSSAVRGSTSWLSKSVFFRGRAIKSRLERDEPDLTPNEINQRIADELGGTADEVAAAMARLAPDVSIHQPAGEGATVADFIADDGRLQDETVEMLIDGERMRERVRDALAVLSERERQIVIARHLAEDDERQTLDQLGTAYGISKERVRQIEVKALQRMGARLKSAWSRPTSALAEMDA